ncbi:MAG: mechanosensitive ion channel family protein, partial [Candidatus Nanohaloarchaea archaeon]
MVAGMGGGTIAVTSFEALIRTYITGGGSIAIAIRVALILAATVIVARLSTRILDRHFRRVSQQVDVSKTSSRLLRRLASAAIYVIGIGVAIYQIPGAKSLSYGLFASAGFLGIVIGFAAQAAIGNIIAGIFIALFDPFRVGDRIETQQHYGQVEDITLRHTVINTP